MHYEKLLTIESLKVSLAFTNHIIFNFVFFIFLFSVYFIFLLKEILCVQNY